MSTSLLFKKYFFPYCLIWFLSLSFLCNHQSFARDSYFSNLEKKLFPGLDNTLEMQAPNIITVGSGTADYTNLTSAFSALNSMVLSGNVTIQLVSGYPAAPEIFPLSGVAAAVVGTYSITIYPAVTGLSVISGNSAATFDFDGVKNIIIDGRVGGIGSLPDLAVENTAITGAAIRFVNGASGNTIHYCKIASVNSSRTGGTILFSGTSGSIGNNNNLIDRCSISDGASTPLNAVYAAGNSANVSLFNTGNSISNSYIYNFYGDTARGINIISGNTGWIITGNSFYQTSSRTAIAGTMNAITIKNSTGNNFIVNNNFIGGSAPNCSGSVWTMNNGSIAATRFAGINLIVGDSIASVIQGNTIANIAWISKGNAASPVLWSGIYLASGDANIIGNTIGAAVGTGSISISTNTAGNISYGIYALASPAVSFSISDNNIGAVNIIGFSTSASHLFSGIVAAAGDKVTISNNLLGSLTTANSINCSTAVNVATTPAMKAIHISGTSVNPIITNNTISNWNNAYNPNTSNLSNFISGIYSEGASTILTGNVVRNLSAAASNSTGTGGLSSVIGIYAVTATVGTNISHNVVHSLANSSLTGQGCIVGLFYSGASIGTNIISKNFIHSLRFASSSGTINGITNSGGKASYQNNLVRLGVDANGSSITTAGTINGINDAAGENSYYFNTIYIGGSGVGSQLSNTYAFNSSGLIGYRDFRNNIFFNNRANASATGGKHYAYRVAGTGPNPQGLTSNNNLIYAPNTLLGGVFGYYNNSPVASPANWKIATGNDSNSVTGNPQFLAPDGSSATVDLHLNKSIQTPANSAGCIITGVTTDFDNQIRDSSPDIGADEINSSVSLGLTAIIQALWNGSICIRDTVKVYLRKNYTPFSLVDSANVFLDTAGQGTMTFSGNAKADSTYYLVVKHRNSIETWSAAGVTFSGGNAVYSFASAAGQAYGNNEMKDGSIYCIYSGDVDQNGFIDNNDLLLIHNDAYNFIDGYALTDLDGNRFVDNNDLLVCDNNAYNLIRAISPISGAVKPKLPLKVLDTRTRFRIK